VRYSLMPSKHALNVSLTEHLSGFIDAQVASGRFGTASEVVRAALRLLEQDLAGSPSALSNGAGPASAAPQVTSAAVRTAGVT
jgi:antitoxin ParD1/3/4